MDAALPRGATSHDFFHRARARLTLDVPPALDDPTVEAKRGDLDLDPTMWEQAGVKATRPAAVLIPVVDRSEPAVLLTLRTELPSHPGQIAFPGGKIEPQDRSPADAALREAAEEIGLAPALIEPIGYLDLYLTFSGFRILPTVARVAPDYKLVLRRAGSRRRVRGSAHLPDGRAEPCAPQPRLEGCDPEVLRHALRRALHLGRDRGDFAQFVRADL